MIRFWAQLTVAVFLAIKIKFGFLNKRLSSVTAGDTPFCWGKPDGVALLRHVRCAGDTPFCWGKPDAFQTQVCPSQAGDPPFCWGKPDSAS